MLRIVYHPVNLLQWYSQMVCFRSWGLDGAGSHILAKEAGFLREQGLAINSGNSGSVPLASKVCE